MQFVFFQDIEAEGFPEICSRLRKADHASGFTNLKSAVAQGIHGLLAEFVATYGSGEYGATSLQGKASARFRTFGQRFLKFDPPSKIRK